jgi:hypothetical protein
MKAILGWSIIVVGFWTLSAVLLWPAFTVLRRRRRGSAALSAGYVAGSAACGLLLFYLLPIAVHGVLGRVTH